MNKYIRWKISYMHNYNTSHLYIKGTYRNLKMIAWVCDFWRAEKREEWKKCGMRQLRRACYIGELAVEKSHYTILLYDFIFKFGPKY